MRTKTYLLATVKEAPADAKIISHQLMIRAGMIRKLATGIYNWLPIGYKVLKKVENIVREEMDNAGCHEILMSAVHPAELWQESGRWDSYTPPLLKFNDRHQREFCYAPTHEECVTDLMRRELQSYKQLPIIVYQIQQKFRDELRPRSGVMRARDFLMKDAYSFNSSTESLQQSYDLMYKTYTNIFTRLGLNFRAVLADTGAIGGEVSHEFQVLTPSGEDTIAISDESDYAANTEMAEALAPKAPRPEPTKAMEKVATPGKRTIDALAKHLGCKKQQILKTLIVKGSKEPLVALLLRGDHELNEVKAEKLPQVATPFCLADEVQVIKQLGCKLGYVGPVGLETIPIIIDRSAAYMADFICGANENDMHFTGVNWLRDLPVSVIADIRTVQAGDPSPDGKGTLKLVRGIEAGHIFQLGTKYSGPMEATVLNEAGRKIPLLMGCYGIGVSRLVAACIEQNHDARGIIWPETMAPFQVALVPIGMHKSQRLKEACESLYSNLLTAGFDVLFDDRDERPGVMFADIDLIGIPHRLVLSEKGLDNNFIEYKHRKQAETENLILESIIETLLNKTVLDQN